jgi:Tol biopolymer transport system component
LKLFQLKLAIIAMLILSACGQKLAPIPTPDISNIQTAAAATAYASITKIPTAKPATPTPDPCANKTRNPKENLLVISSEGKSFYQTNGDGLKTLLFEELGAGSVSFHFSPDFNKAALLTGPENGEKTNLDYVDLGSSKRTPLLSIDAQANLPAGAAYRYLYIRSLDWSPDSEKLIISENIVKDGHYNLDKLYLFDVSSTKLVLLVERAALRAELADSRINGWSSDGKFLYFSSKEKYTILEIATQQETTFRLSDIEVGNLESPGIREYLPETGQFLILNQYTAPSGSVFSQFYLTNLNGSGVTQVTKDESLKLFYDWAPDHKKFSYVEDMFSDVWQIPKKTSSRAYQSRKGGNTQQFGTVDLETGQEIVFDGAFSGSAFSPDSQKIAISLYSSRPPNILLIYFFQSQAQAKLPIFTSASNLSWSPDSRNLFFQDDGKILYFDACELQLRETQLVIGGQVEKIVFTR